MHRALTPKEITQLLAQGCSATNWDQILVHPDCTIDRLWRTHFVGTNTIGNLSGHTHQQWYSQPNGIYDATLIDCKVDDHVLIKQVQKHIANYHIRSHAIIQNVYSMVTEPHSPCGQLEQVSVLNETGGRDIPLHPQMNAHLAYILAHYRYKPQATQRLLQLLDHSPNAEQGYIGTGALIENTKEIHNVYIGDHSQILHTHRLTNGWIHSTQQSPTKVHHGVNADYFTFQAGAYIHTNVELDHVLVGEKAEVSQGFSAEHSMFFTHSHLSRGEACACLGGPFVVSHHKSTLLIGGAMSFSNSGSGTNQSNHMYKLGPIHQGILERGTKTASDSYIMWPSVVGAFSVVMGRHYHHTDSSDFPFSYLMEQQGRTYLVPGINIKSIGTLRDAQKWPVRDKRIAPYQDLIHYQLLNPYTVGKSMAGLAILTTLERKIKDRNRITYNKLNIEKGALSKGIKLYELIIKTYLGSLLVKQLSPLATKDIRSIQQALTPSLSLEDPQWVDVLGMIAPRESIDGLMSQIAKGEVETISDTNSQLKHIYQQYPAYEWAWAFHTYPTYCGVDLASATKADLIQTIEEWNQKQQELSSMLLLDAKKEFGTKNWTSFGVDGMPQDKQKDFEQVRGTYELHPVVQQLSIEIDQNHSKSIKLINALKQ